jgi:hypothetical protein
MLQQGEVLRERGERMQLSILAQIAVGGRVPPSSAINGLWGEKIYVTGLCLKAVKSSACRDVK